MRKIITYAVNLIRKDPARWYTMRTITDEQAADIIRKVSRRDNLNPDQVLERALSSGLHVLNGRHLLRHNDTWILLQGLRYAVYLDGQLIASYARMHDGAWIADKLCQSLETGKEVKLVDTVERRIINQWVRSPRYVGVWTNKK